MNAITPQKARRLKWKIATFDIETFAETGSQLLGDFSMAISSLDGIKHTKHYSAFSLMHEILSRKDGYRWYAHNGANFDFKYLLNDDVRQLLKSRGYGISIIGGKIPKAFALTKGHHKILICDSYKIMPESLRNLGAKLGATVTKGFIDFEGGERFSKDNPDHVQYLLDDVISLHQIVTKYRDIITETFGNDIKCTASSTSFAAWRITIPAAVYQHPAECNEFVRSSYYGGRTQSFFTGIVRDIWGVDVNSLYPYCMRTFGGISHPYITDTLEDCGFYRIVAEVPESVKFGPLPMRKKDGTGIQFPVGRFETYASSVEIRIALTMGCSVDIITGWAFEENDCDMFRGFVDQCERLRATDYSGPLGTACKYLQNNLYGFFGMNPEREELWYGDYPEGDESDSDSWFRVRDIHGEIMDHVWSKTTRQESINCIPAIAAWVTANARGYLLKQMLEEENAGNEVLYCDTDSIFTAHKPIARIHDTEYGAYKYIAEGAEEITLLAPKTYRILGGTKPIYKCKGIPNKHLESADYDNVLDGETVVKEFTQVNSLTRVIRGDVLGRDRATRSFPNPAKQTGMLFQGVGEWNRNVVMGE